MKSKIPLAFLFTSFILLQCAKQTAPTGGPKDEAAPKLIESDPKKGETKFKKEKIELQFDEYVQLNNPREQVLITPSIGKKFEVTAKKNKVILEFNAELKDSTTYNINFRESIQDLNEKNPTELKLAFSTGSYIDSLSITGKIQEIYSGNIGANYTVALNEAIDTFNIFKHQASWVTLANKDGEFSIENLKAGKYILYAFEDRNKNLVVDSKSERHGFISETIELTSSIDNVSINTFKQDVNPLKLISAKPIFNYFLVRTTKGIADYEITTPDKKEMIYSVLEPDKASFKIFNTLANKADSLQIRLTIQDSVENKLDSVVYLKFNQKESPKENLQAKVNFANYIETEGTLYASVTFNKPMPISNPDSIYINPDTLTTIQFTKDDISWNKSLTSASLKKKYGAKANSSADKIKTAKPSSSANETSQPTSKKIDILTFPKGTFISVEIDTANRIEQSIKKIKYEESGVLLTKIDTKEAFILQLLGKDLQVIQEIQNQKNYKFENLIPGPYLLRLIIDTNKNGKWDPGKVSTKTQPEPVVFYKNPVGEKEINLKANWEVGPLLITY